MILQWLIVFCGLVAFAAGLMQILGASIYDIHDVARQRWYLQNPNGRRYRRRPLVSVIVNCRDNQDDIIQCLQSIMGSTYRKLEIIVADGASSDDSRRLVHSFISGQPKKHIKLFARRTQGDLVDNSIAACKKYATGELLLVCQATDRLDSQAITKAVRYGNSEDYNGALALDSRLIDEQSFGNILQRYASIVRRRHLKCTDVTNTQVTSFRTGVVYHREAGLVALRAPETISQTKFIADAHIYQREPVTSWKATTPVLHPAAWPTNFATYLLAAYRICVSIATAAAPAVVGYSFYLAINMHQPDLLWIVVGGVALVAVHAIGNDASLPLSKKLGYILGLPLIYGAVIALMLRASLQTILQIYRQLTGLIQRTNNPTLYTQPST